MNVRLWSKFLDATNLKTQSLALQCFGDPRTIVDHIRLHVQSDNLDFAIVNDRQQVMYGERQIALSAAEIDNVNRAFGWQIGQQTFDVIFCRGSHDKWNVIENRVRHEGPSQQKNRQSAVTDCLLSEGFISVD